MAGMGGTFSLLLDTVPAGLPPRWGRRSHLQALVFAVLSAGPLLLDPFEPSYSSTSSRKPSEPPRTGLRCSQTRQSLR